MRVRFEDLNDSRKQTVLARRQTHGTSPSVRRRAALELARLHVEAGRFTAAEAWIARSHVGLGDVVEAFALRCLNGSIAYERYRGSAFGYCFESGEMHAAQTAPGWRQTLNSIGFPAELSDALQRWCLPFFLLVCEHRQAERRLIVLAGWAAGDEPAAQREAEKVLRESKAELAVFHPIPEVHLAYAFPVASLAIHCRQVVLAEEVVREAVESAPASLRPAVEAIAAYWRFDHAYGPKSSTRTWNLNIRVSERESNELAKSIEKEEFDTLGIDALASGLKGADFRRPGSLDRATRQLAASITLSSAYVLAASNDFARAAEACAQAADLFWQLDDPRGQTTALAMAALSNLSAGDSLQALANFDRLLHVLNRVDSKSWSLGFVLLCSRWGRQLLVNRADQPSSSAAFSLAFRLAQQFGLRVNAAQSLVDLAAVDDSIGFRHLSCARYRVAASIFVRESEARPLDGIAFNRAVQVLQQTAMAYLYEYDAGGVVVVCGDLAELTRRTVGADESTPAQFIDEQIIQWRRVARDRLEHLRLVECLARLLKARFKADDAAARLAIRDAGDALVNIGEGDRAFWEMQFARERNDVAAAADAMRRWTRLGLAGGPLAEIATYLKAAPGDLARDELFVQAVDTGVTSMQACVAVRAYDDAKNALATLHHALGIEWFDVIPKYRLIGRLQTAKTHLGNGEGVDALRVCKSFLVLYEALESHIGDDSRMLTLLREPGLADAYVVAAAASASAGDLHRSFALAEAGRARALKRLAKLKTKVPHGGGSTSTLMRQAAVAESLDATSLFRSTRTFAADRDGHVMDGSIVDGGTLLASIPTPRAIAARRRVQDEIHREAGIENIARCCPPEATLIAFSYTEDVFLSWAVDASGLRNSFSRCIESRYVNNLVARYVRACTERQELDALSSELADLLLTPHMHCFEAAERLVIVPFNDLAKVPFHALPIAETRVPLASRHHVSYLPAAALLSDDASGMTAIDPRDVVVVGRPHDRGDAIERELRQVAALFDTLPVLSEQISKPELLDRLERASVVHIAAHAYSDAVQSWSSAVRLWPDESLTAADLAALDFRAGLVTLGACSTGVSERAQSDPTGFARALLASGVGTCVISLWDVDSEATLVLMDHFYRGIRLGMPPDVALSGAQSAVRSTGVRQIDGDRTCEASNVTRMFDPYSGASWQSRDADWSHPFYWAAFVALGPTAHRNVGLGFGRPIRPPDDAEAPPPAEAGGGTRTVRAD